MCDSDGGYFFGSLLVTIRWSMPVSFEAVQKVVTPKKYHIANYLPQRGEIYEIASLDTQ